MLRAGLVLVFVFSLVVSGAWAASFKNVATKEGNTIILLSGEIVEGDADTLKASIKTANDGGKLVSGIRLNSPGGNLLEGLKLANIVRYAKVATNVAANATCASACFLVYAAGATKFSNYRAQVGVHGASDQQGEETIASGAATISMARAAKELGVPAAIIGRMVVTPPSDMVWLSPADLQSMGTTMVGKPSQTAQPSSLEQTASSRPAEIQPQTKASKSVPTWDEITKNAIALSANQHGGKPLYSRFCEPKQKVCIIGLSYTGNDGNDAFLKIEQDLNGKTIAREVCSLNNFKDVRSCINWDTGIVHKDMKNRNGDWIKVADE